MAKKCTACEAGLPQEPAELNQVLKLRETFPLVPKLRFENILAMEAPAFHAPVWRRTAVSLIVMEGSEAALSIHAIGRKPELPRIVGFPGRSLGTSANTVIFPTFPEVVFGSAGKAARRRPTSIAARKRRYRGP